MIGIIENTFRYIKQILPFVSCLFIGISIVSATATAQEKPSTVRQIAVDPSGQYLAVYRSDKYFAFVNSESGKLITRFAKDPLLIQNMVFSGDAHLLATSGLAISIWSTDQGAQAGELSLNSLATALSFSNDGRLLAAGDNDGYVTIWEVASGKVERHFAAHHQAIDCLAFSNDSRYLAAGSWDNTASIWDVSTGTQAAVLKGHTGWVTALSFNAASTRIVTGGFDGLVNVWEVPSGKNIASATDAILGSAIPIHSVAFSRDGDTVFAVSIGAVGMWKASTGAKIRSFDNLSAQTSLIACRPDGKHIVVVGTDGSVASVDVTTGQITKSGTKKP